MKRNQLIILVGIVVAVIGGVVTFPLWSPYFIDDVVDEAFPDLTSEQRDQIRDMPEAQQDALTEMSEDNVEMAQDTALAMLEDDTNMEEDMPDEEPVVLETGTFNEFDPVHRGSGSATIYELPDGSRFLRFEDFRVTNGPDLHVILVRNIPGSTLAGLDEGYIDLGQLKGNVGNQNYEIPEDVNLDEFVGVAIYCMPFHVNFSVADFSV